MAAPQHGKLKRLTLPCLSFFETTSMPKALYHPSPDNFLAEGMSEDAVDGVMASIEDGGSVPEAVPDTDKEARRLLEIKDGDMSDAEKEVSACEEGGESEQEVSASEAE